MRVDMTSAEANGLSQSCVPSRTFERGQVKFSDPSRFDTYYDRVKEKKKRLRVTPVQLAQLEHFFAINRSPTAARRKEISNTLGMQERQTQIWFQNRRAKAKTRGDKTSRKDVEPLASERPPLLSTGYDIDLHNAINEEERKRFYCTIQRELMMTMRNVTAIIVIPCVSLTVGSWRRIAAVGSRFDLVAYISEVKQCLTWFIQSDGCRFKMVIPLHSIMHAALNDHTGESVLLSLFLSECPRFLIQDLKLPGSSYDWKVCSDWTEERQASTVLRHDLLGPALQLAHLQQNIRHKPATDRIKLQQSSYFQEDLCSPDLSSSPSLGSVHQRSFAEHEVVRMGCNHANVEDGHCEGCLEECSNDDVSFGDAFMMSYADQLGINEGMESVKTDTFIGNVSPAALETPGSPEDTFNETGYQQTHVGAWASLHCGGPKIAPSYS
ncbi:hypothetical protein AX17_001995 [Amanita inopinata Kibby_2008]|nr:hypothetical protein AX17_001995 [Amanita inopinata Kibby_2008]